MGSRLVDADALYGAFEDAGWYDNRDRDDVAEDILMDAPIIDAISVARCEGCEYCTLDSSTRKVLGYDGSNDGIGITYGDGVVAIDSDSWEFEINYCPICGRRLI